MMKGRVCVVYHFFDDRSTYRSNFLHFLAFGFVEEIDYYVLISGGTDLDLPACDNIYYITTPNKGFDFGAICFAVNRIPIQEYEYFIFLNSTVRGPFIPSYCETKWFMALINLLGDEVGVAGVSINNLTPPSKYFNQYKVLFPDNNRDFLAHVQTMAYVLPGKIVSMLMSRNFYNTDRLFEKSDVICRYEIHLSQVILDMGYDLSSLLMGWGHLNFRRSVQAQPKVISYQGDIWFSNMYRGFGIHPLQAIFVKTNRSLYTDDFLDEMSVSCLKESSPPPALASKSTDLAIYLGKIHNIKNLNFTY